MGIEYDIIKNQENIKKHGLPLADAELFDLTTALIREDDREDYGERRFHAIGWLRDHIHVLVYTLRGESVRVISLRRAERKEVRYYASQI